MDCHVCGGLLTGKQKKYCGAGCQKLAARAAWVLKVYGITLAQYDAILEYQGGVCPICRKPPKEGKPLAIDHEHGGRVRGLVCAYPCNLRVIAKLRDHELAQRLADYLKFPPAQQVFPDLPLAPGRPRKKRQPRKRKR